MVGGSIVSELTAAVVPEALRGTGDEERAGEAAALSHGDHSHHIGDGNGRERTGRETAAGGRAGVVADAELAERRPVSLVALSGITGIGPAKLERYGSELLDVIAGLAPAKAG